MHFQIIFLFLKRVAIKVHDLHLNLSLGFFVVFFFSNPDTDTWAWKTVYLLLSIYKIQSIPDFYA